MTYHSPEQVMDALGHRTRRDILKLLQAGPMPVGQIAANFPVSRPAISKHLRLLQQANLVQSHSRGRQNWCDLDPSGFAAARAYLEGFWDQALDNFQRLANEAAGE
jgi:DNA-binding transcriptional ArsR family regulator